MCPKTMMWRCLLTCISVIVPGNALVVMLILSRFVIFIDLDGFTLCTLIDQKTKEVKLMLLFSTKDGIAKVVLLDGTNIAYLLDHMLSLLLGFLNSLAITEHFGPSTACTY